MISVLAPERRDHHGLDRVHPVLGLIENDRGIRLEHLLGHFHFGQTDFFEYVLADLGFQIVKRRKAMHEFGSGIMRGPHHGPVDLIRPKQIDPTLPHFVGLPHRNPYVGIDEIASVDAGDQIVRHGDLPSALPGQRPALPYQRSIGSALDGRDRPEVHPHLGRGHHQRIGHIVVRVAQKADFPFRERLLRMLAHRHHIRQSLRRMLNNRIYGLTKGQYSPTSPRGFVSKSSPYGTVEDPFQPAELCFGARGHFFARAVATDAAGTIEILKAAYNHKGASVCEILQNCVIFNNGTHDSVAKKEDRAKNAIYLEHGKPMLFGENNEYGLMQEGFGLKVVKLGENGITEKDILIHDAHCEDNTLQLKLALMEGPDFPIALGVIRDVEAPTYDDAVHAQIEEVSAKKKYHNFEELLMTNDTWEVK